VDGRMEGSYRIYLVTGVERGIVNGEHDKQIASGACKQ